MLENANLDLGEPRGEGYCSDLGKRLRRSGKEGEAIDGYDKDLQVPSNPCYFLFLISYFLTLDP